MNILKQVSGKNSLDNNILQFQNGGGRCSHMEFQRPFDYFSLCRHSFSLSLFVFLRKFLHKSEIFRALRINEYS